MAILFFYFIIFLKKHIFMGVNAMKYVELNWTIVLVFERFCKYILSYIEYYIWLTSKNIYFNVLCKFFKEFYAFMDKRYICFADGLFYISEWWVVNFCIYAVKIVWRWFFSILGFNSWGLVSKTRLYIIGY